MRSRYIKPGFFTSEQLSECSPFARILFEGLWCYADRRGRLEDRPKKIKVAILPYDNVEIEELLGELVVNELIIRYEAEGKRYIWIPNFLLHQRPHYNEEDSVIPPCEQEVEMCRKGIIKSDAEEKAAKAAKEGKKSQAKQPKVESTCDQGDTDLLPRSQELVTKVESTCDQGSKDFALENLILENLRTRELDTGELENREKQERESAHNPAPKRRDGGGEQEQMLTDYTPEEREVLSLFKGVHDLKQPDTGKLIRQIRTLKADFPAVDLLAEAKKMALWLDSREKKQNAKSNLLLFMRNWVERASKTPSPPISDLQRYKNGPPSPVPNADGSIGKADEGNAERNKRLAEKYMKQFGDRMTGGEAP